MSSVIHKSMELLEAIQPENDKEEWSATEISRKLNIPVQTVHRLLSSLSEARLVYKSKETKKFRLSFSIIQMGYALRNSLAAYPCSLPIMEKLAQKTNHCVCLSVLEGTEGIIVDTVASKTAQIIEPELMRNPLHIGSANKVLLAHLPLSLKEKLINSLLKDDNNLSKEGLESELKTIKKHGFSITVGEIKEGFTEIAVPIFSWEEKTVAAISVLISGRNVKNHILEETAISIVQAAEEISLELGWYK
ncbi:IclR family transcriptional regulator domain-containing protein [Bacillus sp. 1NLA3E]|uniref:IclR family transcriptional regulator n=1 Tax=Bacillus sp. 1NLA3E TaxID=666686 RepID=UPI000247E6EC